MGTQKTRQIMINSILKSIRKAMADGRIVKEIQLVAYLGIDEGVSRRTALNYLKDLELAKKIVRVDGKIFTKEEVDRIEADLAYQEKHMIEAERGNDD